MNSLIIIPLPAQKTNLNRKAFQADISTHLNLSAYWQANLNLYCRAYQLIIADGKFNQMHKNKLLLQLLPYADSSYNNFVVLISFDCLGSDLSSH